MLFPVVVQHKCRPTCVKLAISYIGLADASNGYHVVKIMAWLVSIRQDDCVTWKRITNVHAYIVKPPIRVMYLLIVKIPVSGSLAGNSFHVNDFAKLIMCSKLCTLSLKQRKTKYTKNLEKSTQRLALNLLLLTYRYLNYYI